MTKNEQALEEISNCISSILSTAYRNGTTELAKFKFKEQIATIRTALENQSVLVNALNKINKRFQGEAGNIAGKALKQVENSK